MDDITEKLERLRAWMRECKAAAVAFSGGVDSTLVLKVAVDELGDAAVAMLAVSESLPSAEKEDALALAAEIGAKVEILFTNEMSDERYQSNAPNRCYFCKDHVYRALRQRASEMGISCLLDGMNAGDTLDVRPGRAAARELDVKSPLCELGFTKSDVRDAAKMLGLSNWDKPAAACLASRIPYGTKVTVQLLSQVEKAEAALKALGFHDVRVRHHGDVARVEVPVEAFDALLDTRDVVIQSIKQCGYTYVALDLAGLRSGSANEVLGKVSELR